MSGHAVQRGVAAGGPGSSMAGRIGLADVGLDFDDDAACANAGPVVDENLADQFSGNLEGRPIVENAG